MYYTGIGSRETPEEILKLFKKIAIQLNSWDYILRSGGALGADSAFEDGAGDKKQIFLPWDGFQNKKVDDKNYFLGITKSAFDIAKRYHPTFNNLGNKSKAFMTRNTMQVLGYDTLTPSEFIICWTKDGKDSGGTGQAIRIAKARGIMVYNFYNESDRRSFQKLLETLSVFV